MTRPPFLFQGKIMVNSVQFCRTVLREKRKPWLTRISLVSVRPIPCPSFFVLKNGVNRFSAVSGERSGPVSRMMSRFSGSDDVKTVISPSFSMASAAFIFIDSMSAQI